MPSPYVQTIADFMTRAASARAAGVRDVAAIQARAQASRGSNTGNLIASLGNAAAGTIGQIMQDRREAPLRAMDLRTRELALQGQERDAAFQDQAAKASKDFSGWIQSRPTLPTAEEVVGRYGPELGARFIGVLKTIHPDLKVSERDPTKDVIDQNGNVITPGTPKAPDPREPAHVSLRTSYRDR